VVGAASALLGGGPDGVGSVVGNLTSGGTESLILAVKAARDAHPSTSPTMVLPNTAHAAFAKAGLPSAGTPVVVPVSATTLRPSPMDIAAAIH
jgi:glutamate/tyrosine decarboxylase-like PLP-dependent enzyme